MVERTMKCLIINSVCVISLFITASTASTHHVNNLLRHVKLTKTNLREVVDKWISQPLDHFDPKEKRAFRMRYFENLQFWKPNGPILVFLGGEANTDPVWISNKDSLLPVLLAKETKGALFATEHRYYGESSPEIDSHNKIEYFKFLSSRQAMEDNASLLKRIKSDPKFKSSKVVVIGGSYAGNLAAWMRELYPELVDAAIASSAPVLAKKDFHEYLDTVRYTFSKYGTKDCLDKIENMFKSIEKLLKTKKGQEQLKKELNICPESDLTVLENQESIFSHLYGPLMGISQYGSPSEVESKCNTGTYDLNLIKLKKSRRCYYLDYKSIDWTKTSDAPWIHQFCTEFGYLQTTSSKKQPFIHWNPLEFLLLPCKGFIKGDAEKKMDEGIAKTNKMYGGLTPNVTKVVFTHGDMDPWHKLGVLKDLGPDVPVKMVNGTSHCAIMVVRPEEPEEMKETRKYVLELIKKWIA